MNQKSISSIKQTGKRDGFGIRNRKIKYGGQTKELDLTDANLEQYWPKRGGETPVAVI